jgi:NAD(P)-dependent dehydrogenase (short-subunit alcohol dehydrogenase family)/acyl dehydratase
MPSDSERMPGDSERLPTDSEPRRRVGQLRFSSEDVAEFAAASGDRNPLHLDPSFARSTSFGSCVVHGALVAIGLAGALADQDLKRATALSVRFAGPVFPDRAYELELTRARAGRLQARLIGRGQALATLSPASEQSSFRRSLAPDSALAEISERALAPGSMLQAPLAAAAYQLAAGSYRAGEYSAGPELAALARRFGAGELANGLLEGLAWSSYAVGVQVPGLHSLLAGITLVAQGRGTAASQAVRVREYDPRTGQLVLDGVLRGAGAELISFARIDCFWQPPVTESGIEPLGAGITADAEAGRVAIIGASRGFGAALALELLGRGHEVHAAYSVSRTAAQELARRSGRRRDRLHLHRLDARDPASVVELAEALQGDAPLTGIALCAAPPPLPMGLTASSGAELADYVADSVRLAAVPLGALMPLLDEAGWALFCSSSALASPPRDWPHYISAKAALEGLAGWVATRAPRTRSVVLRPPAMRTDMTNTPSGRLAAVDPAPVAAWIADRLHSAELAPGLSVLTPQMSARIPA